MIALPLTAGMLVLAKPLVLTLFGHKWAHAVGPMQVLSLFALAITIDIPAGTVYKAIGKAHILLRLSIPKALLLIVGLILFTHYGIVPAAACQTVLALSIHDQAGANGGLAFSSANNNVYYQSVGTYRETPSGHKVYFTDSRVAAVSRNYGAIS